MNYSDVFHYLASTWLEQQDLSGKSPSEISEMYFKAEREIKQIYSEKYKPEIPPQPGRRIRNLGLTMDD